MSKPTRYETIHALTDEALQQKISAGFAKFPEPHSAETTLDSGTRIRVTLEVWPTQESIDEAKRAVEAMVRQDNARWN